VTRANSSLRRYFEAAACRIQPRLAWQAESCAEHRRWQGRLRRKLRELLGRSPERVSLRVIWDEVHETERFVRRKVYIRSEKDYWIPAYYFVPTSAPRRAGALVCLHGHSGILPYIREGDEKARALARDHAVDYAPYLAEHGYVTLALVQRGWNETDEGMKHPESVNGCYRMTLNAFLNGTTSVGLRVWDACRAVDFLQDQPEVDGRRIACAGLSGGGTTSLFFAALEPRVRAAMIAGYFCTFRGSIYAMHHCICNCIPHMMEWAEMSDVAALIAPRPLLVISGTDDPIFPIAATRKAYRALAKTYALVGQHRHLESDFFPGGHEWSNRKTLTFLRRHLAGGGRHP